MTEAISHGTRYGYVGQGCRCEECRLATAKYQRRYMRLRAERVRRAGGVPHGTANGYKNYGCRCDDCCDAQLIAAQAYRKRKKKEASA